MRNAGDSGWIVQKFGGTSVGKFPEKVSVAACFDAAPRKRTDIQEELAVALLGALGGQPGPKRETPC